MLKTFLLWRIPKTQNGKALQKLDIFYAKIAIPGTLLLRLRIFTHFQLATMVVVKNIGSLIA